MSKERMIDFQGNRTNLGDFYELSPVKKPLVILLDGIGCRSIVDKMMVKEPKTETTTNLTPLFPCYSSDNKKGGY